MAKVNRANRLGGSRAAAGLMLLVLLLAGCSGQEPAEEEPTPTESPTAGVDRSRTFDAKVTVEATGAAAFAWDGTQEVLLTRVGRKDMDVNLLSAGFRLPEVLPDDRAHRFRWAFDLLGKYADAPGTFTLEGTPQGTQGLRDQAFLIWMQVKDPSKDAVFDMAEVDFLKEFNQLTQPCTLEVGEGERTGTLRCPELSTAEGEKVALTVRWEQTGPDKPSE